MVKMQSNNFSLKNNIIFLIKRFFKQDGYFLAQVKQPISIY